MAGRFSVETVFKAVDRITGPVRKMQNSVSRFARNSQRSIKKLSGGMDAIGAKFKSVGRSAALAGAAILAAGTKVAMTGADFEQAITNVGAVSLKTRSEIEPLEKMAIDLGRTTKFTATQAANAMEVMARAGFNANEIMAATPAVLSAAAASGLEIAEVANHVSNVLKGMGLETTEAARVADVLALASSKTNSSIGSLGESMKNVASTAKQLNIPLEEVVASVALLQDVGLDASVAGSAMNVMLTKMASPSKQITKVMRRLGLSFKDANGDMKPLGTVLGELNTASKKMGGNFDKVAFLAELVGLRGQKAAANLGELFETGKLVELTKALDNAEGSAKKMADLRMNTVQGSMLLLGSAIDAVQVKLFGLNEGPLKKTIDRMTELVGIHGDDWVERINSAITFLIDNFDDLVKTGKQIAGVITLFLSFSIALKVAAVAMGVLRVASVIFGATMAVVQFGIAAFAFVIAALPKALAAARVGMLLLNLAFFANPVGLVVAGIGLLIGLGALLILAWDPVKTFFVSLWSDIMAGIDFVMKKAQAVGKFFGFDFGGVVAESPAAAVESSTAVAEGFGVFAKEAGNNAPSPQVFGAQERISRSENHDKTTNELLIRDETGRAELPGVGNLSNIKLLQTGAFA